MGNATVKKSVCPEEIGGYLQRLFPLARSITGRGNRETIKILQDIVPIELLEYPCGSQVYDWVIPDEWIIRDAYIKGPDGVRVVDFEESNLHVVNYSKPIQAKMTFNELAPRLHVFESNPDVIPYRTSYYNRDWGFCVTGDQFNLLRNSKGLLDICIDSDFDPNGSMTIGELLIPGKSDEELLVSTYCCHPSMANDNLSGLLVTSFLARDMLSANSLSKCWRFVIVPETIGAIAYLSHNEKLMKNISCGLVVTTCGGPGPFGYKKSFLGDHLIDRVAKIVFRDLGVSPISYPFVPDGSDERQYSSQGFRIPTITITRDKYYEYPEYHTSADNLEFVNGRQISESLDVYRHIVEILDRNMSYRSAVSHGEMQLGIRNLYPKIGGSINQVGAGPDIDMARKELDAIMWLLFWSDGEHDILSIAEKSDIPMRELISASEKLLSHQLLVPADH